MKEFNSDNAFVNSPRGELVITFISQSYNWSKSYWVPVPSETRINRWYVAYIRGHRDTDGVERPNEAMIVMTMIFEI